MIFATGPSTHDVRSMSPLHPVRFDPPKNLLLLRLILYLAGQRIPLCLDTLLSPLARCLGLVAFGLHFFLEDTLTLFLGLGLVDL